MNLKQLVSEYLASQVEFRALTDQRDKAAARTDSLLLQIQQSLGRDEVVQVGSTLVFWTQDSMHGNLMFRTIAGNRAPRPERIGDDVLPSNLLDSVGLEDAPGPFGSGAPDS